MKAQESRRVANERYRALFLRASDAIVVFDAAGAAILDANKAALTLYGYSRREFLLLKASELLAEPPDRAASPQFPPGLPTVLEHRKKDGAHFPAETSYGSYWLNGRNSVMAFTRDISERKKAEDAERLNEREAMRKGFISMISHELRTPITAIKGFTETLRRGGVEDVENRLDFIRIIESNADRLERLIEDILALAALESEIRKPKPERVPLRRFIETFASEVSPLAEHREVSIRLDIDDTLVAWCDPDHLDQILQNLIDNGIKYNKVGGELHVQGRRIGGNHAQLSVRDTGIGIAPGDLTRIFQKFERAESAKAMDTRGMGLGLYVTKNLVESNGGRLWVESRKEEGSAFHFTAPLAEEARAG